MVGLSLILMVMEGSKQGNVLGARALGHTSRAGHRAGGGHRVGLWGGGV